MSSDELWERVRHLLVTEFEIAAEAISPDARLHEDLGMDSLDLVDLVVELERFVGKRIDNADLKDVRTVGDVIGLLESLAAA